MDITKTLSYKRHFNDYWNWVNQRQIKSDLKENKRREFVHNCIMKKYGAEIRQEATEIEHRVNTYKEGKKTKRLEEAEIGEKFWFISQNGIEFELTCVGLGKTHHKFVNAFTLEDRDYYYAEKVFDGINKTTGEKIKGAEMHGVAVLLTRCTN